MSDAAFDYVRDRLDRLEALIVKRLDDQEARLRRCERWMYALPATVVLAVASIVLAFQT